MTKGKTYPKKQKQKLEKGSFYFVYTKRICLGRKGKNILTAVLVSERIPFHKRHIDDFIDLILVNELYGNSLTIVIYTNESHTNTQNMLDVYVHNACILLYLLCPKGLCQHARNVAIQILIKILFYSFRIEYSSFDFAFEPNHNRIQEK